MSDSQTIRQLEQQLAGSEESTDAIHKIGILNDLAWALSDTEMQRAYALSETAYTLANSPHDGVSPDQAGMAYSLRTQGYINQRLGDYPKGMSQLLQARGIFESLRIDDGLADVLDGIAGIYYQIGDFAEMLNFSYQQLEIAQRIGDRRRVANAYNNLANVYFESGDYDRAIETLHHNLQAAGELGYGRIVALSYLNLAETYLRAGDGERALENALAALQVSREAGLTLFQVYAFDFIGKSYIKLGSPQQATDYLEQALALSERLESKVTQSLVQLSLGEVYRAMQQPERTLAYAQQAVAVAQALDARSDLFKGHLLVAEIYEQLGDPAQALHHFKKYHAYRGMVFNQEADQRLKVLEVVHDTETARREAEIAHLRTVELQQEIDQHTRVRLQLQRQLDYVQALARCSQTLLLVAECEARQQEVLNEALEHLRVGSQASRAYVFRNFQDPDLGSCMGIFAEACAPDIHPHLGVPGNRKFPWSRLPAPLLDALQAGKPAGGPVEILFAGTPSLLEELRHQVNPLLSVQCFPIFINVQWWGFVGFDDCVNARHLGEQEIMLLGTAAEMIASSLQRWQAELGLRSLNDRLEEQVSARTAELSDTVILLKQEIAERERAEAEIQQMVGTLEQRVADRTEELTAFLDLVLLAGQAVSLDDIVDQALSRIIEVTRSRALCVHLMDADGATLRLAAQQGLSAREAARVQSVRPRPAFRRWLQQPNDPLVSTDLSEIVLLPSALRLPGSHTYLGAQIRIGQQIAGLLSYFRPGDEGFGVDEVALGTALAEQMGLVLETDRLRANAEAMAVMEERQRLARDLHDSVTQSLYSLSLLSRAAREAAEDGDANRLQRILTEVERNTLHTLREMRLLLYELRPADLEQEGLVRAIELRLNAVERRANLQLDARLDELTGLSPSQEAELYHIVVEALNNVVKHAAATRVALHLTQAGGAVHLRIVDDGQGFNPAQTNGGMGLRNIRERVARLGGQLVVSSEPGGGTRLEAAIPCRPEEER